MGREFRRLLIAGGAGFIGSNFVRLLRARRPETETWVLDKLTYAGNRANLAEFEGQSGYRFVQGEAKDVGVRNARQRRPIRAIPFRDAARGQASGIGEDAADVEIVALNGERINKGEVGAAFNPASQSRPVGSVPFGDVIDVPGAGEGNIAANVDVVAFGGDRERNIIRARQTEADVPSLIARSLGEGAGMDQDKRSKEEADAHVSEFRPHAVVSG